MIKKLLLVPFILGLTFGPQASGVSTITFTDMQAVPIPTAVWLFGTALIGLTGFSRRAKVV